LPGYESVQWYGLLAPAGTSREIVARLYTETVAILGAADNRRRLAADGAEVVVSTPEMFGGFLKAEFAKWARVAQEANIKVE